MESYLFYLTGPALVIAGVLLGRGRGGNQLRARDISGNVIVGDVTGTVTQTSTRGAEGGKQGRDVVAWTIGGVGILVMLAQLAVSLWGTGS